MRTLERRLAALEGSPGASAFNLDVLSEAELIRLEVIVASGERDEDVQLSAADRAMIAKIQPGAAA